MLRLGPTLLALAVGIPAIASPGDLDPTFGPGGRIMPPVPPSFSGVTTGLHKLLRQPDGKLVAAGGGTFEAVFKLARFATDGALDPSFGAGGIVDESFGTCCSTPIFDTALTSDGKIIAVGGLGVRGLIARFDTDGTLDAGFGNGGTVASTQIGPQYRAVALQADGAVLAAGDDGVERFDATGAPDAGFNGGVAVATDARYVARVAVQPDGRILALLDWNSTSAVARFNGDGSPDTTFGTAGRAALDFLGTTLALQPDGGIVVVGDTRPASVFVVRRLLADGTVDASFGSGGTVAVDLAPGNESPIDVLLQPDGKIVVAGETVVQFPYRIDAEMVRLLPDGSLDPTFGAGGVVTTDFAGQSDIIDSIVREPDGRLTTLCGALSGDPIPRQTIGLARWFAGTCGDGTLDGGEECDDGNLDPDDGCDPHCCVADADGDGVCDSFDACTTPVAGTHAKLTATKLASFAPNDRVAITAQMTLPAPLTPPLDPVANGLRLIVRSTRGTEIDVTLPAGAYVDPPGRGWKTTPSGRRWTYLDATAQLPAGIRKAVVADLSSQVPGLVKVVAGGAARSYQNLSGHGALAATIVLDPAVGPTRCAELAFPQGCTDDTAHGRVSCR